MTNKRHKHQRPHVDTHPTKGPRRYSPVRNAAVPGMFKLTTLMARVGVRM